MDLACTYRLFKLTSAASLAWADCRSDAACGDDLLTARIVDANDSIGSAVEEVDASTQRDHYVGRLTTIATTIRDWTNTNPHEYALIYGSPVTAYAAPDDTIDPAV